MHAVTALQSTALSFSSGTCIAALLSEPNGTDGMDGDVAALRAAVHISSCSPRAAAGSFYDTSSSSLPRWARYSGILNRVFIASFVWPIYYQRGTVVLSHEGNAHLSRYLIFPNNVHIHPADVFPHQEVVSTNCSPLFFLPPPAITFSSLMRNPTLQRPTGITGRTG